MSIVLPEMSFQKETEIVSTEGQYLLHLNNTVFGVEGCARRLQGQSAIGTVFIEICRKDMDYLMV